MATPQDISKSTPPPEVSVRRKPAKASSAAPVPQIMKQGGLTPWLYLLPALLVMTFFIVYPMINTISLSFRNRDGTASAATTCREGNPCWGVLENYRYALTAEFNTSSPRAFWNSFWAMSARARVSRARAFFGFAWTASRTRPIDVSAFPRLNSRRASASFASVARGLTRRTAS